MFGKSSDLFDYYKGSFDFPLLIVLEKEMDTFFYGMDIFDSKGYVIFRIFKILNNNESKNKKLHHPAYELEFSRQERNHFLNLFYGYLVGCFHILQYVTPIQPFLKTIEASWITYGYKENKYFETGYDTEEAYNIAIQSFEEVYGSIYEQIDIDGLLLNITS